MKLGTTVLTFAGAASLLISGLAVAGQKDTGGTVNIYGSNLRVMGSLSAARNSSNTVEYLGCKVSVSPGSAPSVTCSAQNSAGVQFSCSSSDAGLVNVALGIKGDSFINVNRDSAGTCTLLAVDNSSIHGPKAP